MRPELSVGLDFTRVVACLMVVILHFSAPGMLQFDENWFFSNIYDSFTRSCVPIFLMLSGALLLSKKEDSISFYKKRFIRILPPLFFWSGFYIVWKTYMGTGYGDIINSILAVIKGPVYYHLWYLYIIVGIYLFMPFLSKIYQSSSNLEKNSYILIWFIVACVFPILSYFYPYLGNIPTVYELSSFAGLGGYVFVGAYAFERLSRQEGKHSHYVDMFVFFLSSALTAVGTYLLSKHDGVPNQLFYSYLSPLVALASISGFRMLVIIGMRITRYSSMLNVTSGCTLGVYGIHAFIMNRFSLFYGPLIEGESMLWVIPFLSILTFLFSLATIYSIRTIKLLRIAI